MAPLIAVKTQETVFITANKKMVSDTVGEVAGSAPMTIFHRLADGDSGGKISPPAQPDYWCGRKAKYKEKENNEKSMNLLSYFLGFSVLFILPSARWFVNRRLIPASTEKITRCQAQVCLGFHLLTPSRS